MKILDKHFEKAPCSLQRKLENAFISVKSVLAIVTGEEGISRGKTKFQIEILPFKSTKPSVIIDVKNLSTAELEKETMFRQTMFRQLPQPKQNQKTYFQQQNSLHMTCKLFLELAILMKFYTFLNDLHFTSYQTLNKRSY